METDTKSVAYQKKLIIEAGRRLWQRGMVAANDGNISVRLKEGGFLISRSNISKGFMTPADVLLLDKDGALIQQTAGSPGFCDTDCEPLLDQLDLADGGKGVPSVETRLHLAIYALCPDVNAIIHSHAPHATAFALGNGDINSFKLEDLRVQLGEVVNIPYSPAGTLELAARTAQAMKGAAAGLMANHGAVTVGNDLRQAYYRMEALEQAARIIILSRSI